MYAILNYHRLGSKTFGENDGRIDEQSLSDPPTEEPPIEAQTGERDPRWLADGALLYLSQQKLSRTPPTETQ